MDAVMMLLLRISAQAAVVVLVVLLAQRVLRRWLPPGARYALWLLVVVKLVVPVGPESRWSIFNLTPEPVAPAAVPVVMLPRVEVRGVLTPAVVKPVERWTWRHGVAAAWAAGVVLFMGRRTPPGEGPSVIQADRNLPNGARCRFGISSCPPFWIS